MRTRLCLFSCLSVLLSVLLCTSWPKGLSHKTCPKSSWYNSPLGAPLRELVLEVSPPFQVQESLHWPSFLCSCLWNMGALAFRLGGVTLFLHPHTSLSKSPGCSSLGKPVPWQSSVVPFPKCQFLSEALWPLPWCTNNMSIHKYIYIKIYMYRYTCGLVVKSTVCCSREPEFSSQDLHCTAHRLM